MSNTPSLLPCPFCGGINIIHCGHHMYCHACGADGPDADSQHESEARSAWNSRTPQPARQPLIADEICDAWEFVTGHQIQFGPSNEGRPMFISTDEVIDFARAIEQAHGITQKGGG